jgi:hypothetical protein
MKINLSIKRIYMKKCSAIYYSLLAISTLALSAHSSLAYGATSTMTDMSVSNNLAVAGKTTLNALQITGKTQFQNALTAKNIEIDTNLNLPDDFVTREYVWCENGYNPTYNPDNMNNLTYDPTICTNRKKLTPESTMINVGSGESIYMMPEDQGFCFLTYIQGDLADSNEKVSVAIETDPTTNTKYWTLEGSATTPYVMGKARCFRYKGHPGLPIPPTPPTPPTPPSN